MTPLGLISGKGKLPRLLIQACQSVNRPVFALAYKDQTDPETVENIPHIWLSLGEMGKAFDFFKQNNVTDVILAGGFQRPSLQTLKTDWKGAMILARIGSRILGDDGLLTHIEKEIEKEGFRMISSQNVLSSLQKPEGPLGTFTPDAQAIKDIQVGVNALNLTSSLDMGQAAVIQQGLIIGLEGVEGTDALIQRCGPLQKEGTPGILVKMAKKNQNQRVDMPVIGLDTIKNVIQAGFGGVAFEANKALVIDADEIRAEADQHKIFVIAVTN